MREYCNKILNSVESGDFKTMAMAAHTIKSSSATLGAISTVYAAKALEALVKNDRCDIEQVHILVQKLEEETEKADAAITRKMASS